MARRPSFWEDIAGICLFSKGSSWTSPTTCSIKKGVHVLHDIFVLYQVVRSSSGPMVYRLAPVSDLDSDIGPDQGSMKMHKFNARLEYVHKFHCTDIPTFPFIGPAHYVIQSGKLRIWFSLIIPSTFFSPSSSLSYSLAISHFDRFCCSSVQSKK